MKTKNILRRLVALAATTICLAAAGTAQAGSVFLTGHDIDFHNGADGYDSTILDWLRGAGTGSEIAAANYKVGLIRSIDAINPAGGSVGGVLAGSWAGGVTAADPTQFANAAAFTTFLGSIDVLVVASQVACGGCDFSPGDSAALNVFAPEIAVFFNAGGDIWGNTVASLGTGYGYLPPSAAASGTSISGSNGFVATAAGAAIGITALMVNGDATHNNFTSFDSDFVVFETRPTAGNEVISIGIRDAIIGDGGIGTDAGTVPEPGVLALLSLGALGMALTRRRKRQ